MPNLKLIPLIEALTIQTKDLTVQKIDFETSEFKWCQVPFVQAIENQYNNSEPVRIIVLKARQLGLSTISEAVLYNWCFLHPGVNSLVIAHETEASISLFEKCQLFWETWPFNGLYHTRHSRQNRLSWMETRSSMQVATAKNVRSGRSRTIHALHASEVAFWDDPLTLMTGLSNTIPSKHGSIVILESTANGVGNWFHQTWQDAVQNKNGYMPLFFPWYKHPEYQVIHTTIGVSDLDKHEYTMFKHGVDLAHLEWRRMKIASNHGDADGFKQEYPTTPREAFLTTGRNVFNLDKLEDCYQPKKGKRGIIVRKGSSYDFREKDDGPLTIFRTPSHNRNWGSYVVAGDPTHSTMGDNACIQVLSRQTLEQVAVWHGKCAPVQFAHELMRIGYYYNAAIINTEIEGPGYATIGVILDREYPNVWKYRWPDRAPGKVSTTYGWSTNFNRKNWAIGLTIARIHDKSVTIHDEITFDELADYIVLSDGELSNGTNTDYDDAVMAFAIGVVTVMTEGAVQMTEDDYSPLAGITRQKFDNQTDLYGQTPWDAFDSPDAKGGKYARV